LLGVGNIAQKIKQAKEELSILNTKEKSFENKHKELPIKVNRAFKEVKNKEKLKKINPKLFIKGKFNRKKNMYISKGFYILSGLEEELKRYCAGADITVYNYLIYLGLEKLKKEEEMIFVDAKELETLFKTGTAQEPPKRAVSEIETI